MMIEQGLGSHRRAAGGAEPARLSDETLHLGPDRYQAFVDRCDAALGNRSRLAKIVDALQHALCRCGVVKHRDGLRHVLQRGKPRLAEGQVTAELDHIPAQALALPRTLDHPRQVGQPLGRGQTLP